MALLVPTSSSPGSKMGAKNLKSHETHPPSASKSLNDRAQGIDHLKGLTGKKAFQEILANETSKMPHDSGKLREHSLDVHQKSKVTKSASDQAVIDGGKKGAKVAIHEERARRDEEAALAAAAAQLSLQHTVAKKNELSFGGSASENLGDKKKGLAEKKVTDEKLGSPSSPSGLVIAEAKGEPKQNTGKKIESSDDRKFTVIDKRTEGREKLRGHGQENSATQAVNATVDSQNQPKTGDAKNSQEFQVVYQSVAGKPRDQFDTEAKNTAISRQDAAAFQKFLVERGHNQIVEQARIILRDHNQGEIRLTLYPETLGKVKVALNLKDDRLAGRIFVENQTVKDIFQQNMDQLVQSFRQDGYRDLNIQVSVGGEQKGSGNAEQDPDKLRVKTYGKNVSESAPADLILPKAIRSVGDQIVNLTA